MASLFLLATGHPMSAKDVVADFAIVVGITGLVAKLLLTAKFLGGPESPAEAMRRKRAEAARAKRRALDARRDARREARRSLVPRRNSHGGGVWRASWSAK